NLAPPRQPVRPDVITHVLGTFCYPCLRAGRGEGWWRGTRFPRNERQSGCKVPTPAPFGAIIADMPPRIIHIPLSGDRRRGQNGFAAGRACTAIAFVFRKACSRACRSSFALACRPLSGYFCR